MQTLITALSFFLVFFCPYLAQSAQTSLVTYYPSPNGNYENLNVSGNIGIGSAAVNSLLTVGTVLSTNNLTPVAIFNTTSNSPILVGNGTGDTGLMIGYNGNDIQGRSGATYNNSTSLLLNDLAGNVGVGAGASTDQQLVVSGSVAIANNNNTSVNRLDLADGDWNHYIYSSGSGGNNMYFEEYDSGGAGVTGWHFVSTKPLGTEVFTISNGDVGIGQTAPAHTVVVQAAAAHGAVSGVLACWGPGGCLGWCAVGCAACACL